MTDIMSPVGRLVQGSVTLEHQKDMNTKQPLFNADGSKKMGLFLALAFPKLINGQPNPEFHAFRTQLAMVAAAAWPQFFPQGPSFTASNPNFSWKIQDGDGTDNMGQSVAGKPGWKDHWIIKFASDYPCKVFAEGKFAAHEELQPQALETIKRGYWLRILCEVKSNMADLTKQQKAGIAIYPKLISFVGGRKEDEISGGPDAMETFGKMAVGYVPPGLSQLPGTPVGGITGGALPPSPSLTLPGATLALPTLGAAPSPAPAPVPTITPAAAAQGHTVASLTAAGHSIEALVQAGFVTMVAPAPASLPSLTLPTLGAAPAPAALPNLTVASPPPMMAMAPAPSPAAPQYQLIPGKVPPGATFESLAALNWTPESLVAGGYAIRVG